MASILADRTPADPEALAPSDLLASGHELATVDDRAVVYHEQGQGEPSLVFIHGFAESLQIWRPIQNALAAQHHSVALDLWGFAASARPEGASPSDWVNQVIGLMDSLSLGTAVLVGHSLGGRVSLMTARAHPERVRGLVLCDADWGQAPHGYVLVWLLAHTPVIPLLLGKLRTNDRHLRRMLQMVATPNFPFSKEWIDAIRAPLRVKGTARCWRHLGAAPPLRELRGLTTGIRCPALVVHGQDDPIVPLWSGRKLAQRLGAELRVIPECGHFAPEEYPEVVLAAIRELLTGL